MILEIDFTNFFRSSLWTHNTMPSETTQNTNGLPLVSKSTENSVVLLPKERDPVVLARVCDTRLKVAPPTLHGRDETLWLFADSDKLFETLLLFNKLLSERKLLFFHLRFLCLVSLVLSFHCKCHQETPLLIFTITLMLEWMFLNGTLTKGYSMARFYFLSRRRSAFASRPKSCT